MLTHRAQSNSGTIGVCSSFTCTIGAYSEPAQTCVPTLTVFWGEHFDHGLGTKFHGFFALTGRLAEIVEAFRVIDTGLCVEAYEEAYGEMQTRPNIV
jgi:hypothetical protein